MPARHQRTNLMLKFSIQYPNPPLELDIKNPENLIYRYPPIEPFTRDEPEIVSKSESSGIQGYERIDYKINIKNIEVERSPVALRKNSRLADSRLKGSNHSRKSKPKFYLNSNTKAEISPISGRTPTGSKNPSLKKTWSRQQFYPNSPL